MFKANKKTAAKMNTKIKQLIYSFNISRRRRSLLCRRELAVAGSRLKRIETRFSHFALSPKPLLVVGALMIALQPILVSNINSAGAASNPALALTGYIWENEDGSAPDTVSQIAAADGTIETPWGGRVNLRAQLKNTGDALSDTDLGLFYDKGDGLWNQVANSSPSKNTTTIPVQYKVDATGDVGLDSYMAVDNDGIPWVSYRDQTNSDLKVAKYVGSGGNCDGAGAGSDAWECTVVDGSAGSYSSIVADRSGGIWVSYQHTGADLWVAKYVGSGGNCDNVSSGSDAWECTAVDVTDGVGYYTGIALDANENPWVSHYDSTNANLEVAKYVGSGGNCDTVGAGSDAWECTTVDATDDVGRYDTSIAFGKNNEAWIAYRDQTNTTLEVAKYVGSGGNCDTVGAGSDAWECTTVDTSGNDGYFHSIAIDNNGDPWVSHYDVAPNNNLKVAKYVGSGGNCDSVGAGSDAWECTVVDSTDSVGIYSSIAMDSAGDAWISYADSTNTTLRLAKYVGSGGNCDSVGAGSDAWECTIADRAANNVGFYTSIAFDPYGYAWMSYTDMTDDDLLVVRIGGWPGVNNCDNNAFGAAWDCSDVVTSGEVGEQSSMALDNSGVPWIAYVDSTNSDLEIAKHVGKGGTGCAVESWDCSVIESTSAVGYHPSLAFDEGNNPWISHRNDTSNDLRVAHYVGSGGSCNNAAWECEGVDTTGNIDSFTSIAIDSSNDAWVSYMDATAGTLKVANYVGGGSGSGCNDNDWTCTTVEGANSNGDGSSIAFDTAGDAWVSFFSTGGSPGDELQIAKYVGSGGSGCNSSAWTCSVIYDDNLVDNTSIAFDPAGDAWIAFKVNTGDLIVAKYVGSGGSNCGSGVTDWDCTVVEDTNDNGQGVSIAFDPAGNAWISYQDETDLTVKVARYVGSGGRGCASSAWACNVVQSGVPNNNMNSTLVFDNNGTAWLSYYDNTSVDLKLAKLERAGEISLSQAQRYANGAVISESHADMTSVTDTTNRDDADCIGGGTWNNGKYFNSNLGSGISLPDGSSTAQCTEVVFTLDLAQAEIGDNYRFMIATKDSWDPNKSTWRGLSGGGTPPELRVTDVSFISGKDNSRRLPNCDTDTDWGCEELDDGDTDDLQYPKIAIDSRGNPWTTWEDEVTDEVVVANYVGSGGTGCSTAAWHCENVAPAGLYGGFSAIAAGEDGSIWVSYYANATTALGVAKYVGSGGNCDATYGANGSDAWDCTTVDESSPVGRNVGERTDIAVDSYGNPWISYYDTTALNLKVAYYVGSGGNCDDGSLGGSDAWNCETVDDTGTSGRYSSIAIGDNNEVWIMHHDHSDNSGGDDLRIAHYVGTGGNCTSDAWDCKILDDTAGEYGGIAIDHDGNPWVSYRSNVGFDLMVANYVGTGGSGCYTGVTDWSCVKVDTTTSNAYQSSIAIAPDGNPWITYNHGSSGNLLLSKYVGSGGNCDDIFGGDSSDAWECSTIEATGTVGLMPYIGFDHTGNAWIVHKDDGNNTIRVAKTHRPIVEPSIDYNQRVKGRNGTNGFARYLSSFGKSNASNPGICNGISDYYGACGLFHASGDYDTITAQANESPYWTFAQSFDNNNELPTAQWEGLTTLAPSTSGTAGDITLQVYRYGTTNAWEDVASDSTSSSCSTTNCRLEGSPTGTASEYFESKDGKYWVNYRLYQEPSTSSSVTFKTDQFKAATNEQRARHGSYLQDGYKRPLNWR